MMREDEYQPFNWGLHSIELDQDAIADGFVSLRSCEARFKDGTKLLIPNDGTVDPIDIRSALANCDTVSIYLAIPALQPGLSNVEKIYSAVGPRPEIDSLKDDEEGSGEQPTQIRRVRARLLLSGQDHTGYEILPLVRIERSSQVDAPARLDRSYVPPLLVLD